MRFAFEIERRRYSVTQGEIYVLCNGRTLAEYGDAIEIGGRYGGSIIPDFVCITAAMRDYQDRCGNRL